MTKSTKSQQRECSPLFANSPRVHELVARSSAWRVRAINNETKVGSFITLHNCNYITRANIAHEEAEQIRARIVCTPAYIGVAGVNKVDALTEWKAHFLFWLYWGFIL